MQSCVYMTDYTCIPGYPSHAGLFVVHDYKRVITQLVPMHTMGAGDRGEDCL